MGCGKRANSELIHGNGHMLSERARRSHAEGQ